MSKKTKWRFVASNMIDTRTEEEKEKYRKKQFAWGLALERMKTEKPHFGDNDKPFYDNSKKKKQKKSA